MEVIRVLVVGNDPLARHGLSTLLAGQPDLVVVGQIAAGEDFASAVSEHDSEVILWDLGFAPGSGLDRLRELEGSDPSVLAVLAGETGAVEALAAGARGAILRDADPERLAAALRAVRHGLVVVEESLAESLAESWTPPRPSGTSPLLEALTPRELEVLQLLAQGLSNKLIAARLEISEHTAKFHVNAILGKLGVQSRTEAIVRAARLGLVIL